MMRNPKFTANIQVDTRKVIGIGYKMIKSELIANIASTSAHIPEKDIAAGVNLILEHLGDTLAQGERIEIRGFGSFSVHYRPPRNAHNPKTGAKVVTAAKYSPHFKPGKELRERVNASRDFTEIIDTSAEDDD